MAINSRQGRAVSGGSRTSFLSGAMLRRLAVLIPIVLVPAYSPLAHSNPGYTAAKEITGRVVRSVSGNGILDVSVQLLGPDYVGMDITTTNKDGSYTIDLDVLEEKELANLRSFSIETQVAGKPKKLIKLGDGLKLSGNVLRFKEIRLP